MTKDEAPLLDCQVAAIRHLEELEAAEAATRTRYLADPTPANFEAAEAAMKAVDAMLGEAR